MMLQDAFKQAFAQKRLILTLYFASLFSGLLLLIYPAVLLFDFATLTAIADAVDGVDLYQFTELSLDDLISTALDSETALAGASQIGPALGLTLLGLIVLAFLLSAYLRGGSLALLNQAVCSPVDRGGMQGFHKGARRWFWSIGLLQMLHGMTVIIVASVTLTVFAVLAVESNGVMANVSLVIGVLLLLCLQGWFELSISTLIAHDTRNPFRALWRAMGHFWRKPLIVLGFYLIAWLLMLATQLVFRFGIVDWLPASLWVLVLLIQQLSLIVRLGLRIFRYAGALHFVQPIPSAPEKLDNSVTDDMAFI